MSTRHGIVTLDGTEISFEVFEGAEPAVVILHGLAGSGREFVPTAQALSGRKVVLVDQRGHGLSTRRPRDLSRAAFVSDVRAVIERVATSPVVLIGQSMGAHTAMLVASAHPELVARLILLEGNHGGDNPDNADKLGAYFSSWKTPYADPESALADIGASPIHHAWVADMDAQPDGLRPRFDADIMAESIRPLSLEHWTSWERVAAPTLVIYADGGMFTEAQKAEFVERNPFARRVDLAGASHDAHLDAFEQWIRAVVTFLDERGA